MSSWAVVTWSVVSPWAVAGAFNTPFLPVGPNLAVVVSSRVRRCLCLLRQVLMVQHCDPSFWIAPRVHMGSGIGFMSHALCGALVTIVPGVVSVCPTIFCGFIAPDVVREVPAAESAGAVGAPCWLISSPVFDGITAALAALVFVSVGILVLLWGLFLCSIFDDIFVSSMMHHLYSG